MSEPYLIRTDHPGGVVQITLNNAPVNALSADFLMGFADLMAALEQDQSVRAIVLSSPFKVLSAGLNLKEAQGFDLAAQNAVVNGLNVGFLRLFACAKPTVVAVNGAAIAGGLFFVLASDLRVAHPRAMFGLAEVRVGVDFPVGPMEIARATLSKNALRRMMLTGQPVSCDWAEAQGIVDVIDEDTLNRALTEAQTLAESPSKAYAAVKRQIRGAVIDQIEAAMTIDNGQNGPAWFTDETVTAMRKMLGQG